MEGGLTSLGCGSHTPGGLRYSSNHTPGPSIIAPTHQHLMHPLLLRRLRGCRVKPCPQGLPARGDSRMAWNKGLPWKSARKLLGPKVGVGILHWEKRSALASTWGPHREKKRMSSDLARRRRRCGRIQGTPGVQRGGLQGRPQMFSVLDQRGEHRCSAWWISVVATDVQGGSLEGRPQVFSMV